MKREEFINDNAYISLLGELKKFEIDDLSEVKKIAYSSLTLGNKFISNDLSDLKNFTELETISLSDFIINRKNIEIIQGCLKLKEYEFKNCDFKDKINISGEKIKLYNCKKIYNISLGKFKEISIQNVSVKDIDIAMCVSLELSNCGGIANLKSYDNINELEICFSSITNNELGFIKELQNCKIKLVECEYQKEILEKLKELNNVKIIKERLLCENTVDIEEE